MPLDHLYVIFGEMSVEVFYPFFYWVVYCFGIELHELFILEINPLSVALFADTSPILRIVFSSCL